MKISILTKTKPKMETSCDSVTLNTVEGQISILPMHAHYISTSPISIVRIGKGDRITKVAIKRGIVWVLNNQIRIFTEDYVKDTDESDPEDVKRSIRAIKRRIEKGDKSKKLKEELDWYNTILKLIEQKQD